MKSKLLNGFLALLVAGILFIDNVNANCGAPGGINLVDIRTNSARFEWTPVTGASYYRIQYRKAGTGTWQTCLTSAPSCEIAGLTSGTSYEWQIQTNCQYGFSAIASFDKFTTLSHPINSPVGMTSHSLSSTAVLLSWSAIQGTCNYILQWKTSSSTTWTTVTGISSTSFNLSTLSSCTEYQFRVRTSCLNSVSSYSTPTAFKTSGCIVENNNNQTIGAKLMHKDNENIVRFELYPNPVRDNLKVEYNSPNNGEITVTIYNILGKNMMSSKNVVEEGKNSINLNTTELADGLYLFELENNGELIRSKFMIRK